MKNLASPMHIISCGRACRITPMFPPEMMKLPNTRPNSSTIPIIWNMEEKVPAVRRSFAVNA